MKIDTATLVAVSKNFFARYDSATLSHERGNLAFEAVGILRAFVSGYEDEEHKEIRQYEATAHIPDEEDNPF
jgi:hypothetical protein